MTWVGSFLLYEYEVLTKKFTRQAMTKKFKNISYKLFSKDHTCMTIMSPKHTMPKN